MKWLSLLWVLIWLLWNEPTKLVFNDSRSKRQTPKTVLCYDRPYTESRSIPCENASDVSFDGWVFFYRWFMYWALSCLLVPALFHLRVIQLRKQMHNASNKYTFCRIGHFAKGKKIVSRIRLRRRIPRTLDAHRSKRGKERSGFGRSARSYYLTMFPEI